MSHPFPAQVHAADFSRDEFNKAVRMLKGYAARNKRPDLAEGTVLTDVAPPLEGKVNEKMKVAEVDDADLDEKLYFIDVETETGGTALLVACAAGNVLLADELLQRGAELCRNQPLVWVVLTKLENSLARSNQSRFG
jgi:ankyrin repeat protein